MDTHWAMVVADFMYFTLLNPDTTDETCGNTDTGFHQCFFKLGGSDVCSSEQCDWAGLSELLKDQWRVFNLGWSATEATLGVDPQLCGCSYSGALIPDQPMHLRLNVSNDFYDMLEVDYIIILK